MKIYKESLQALSGLVVTESKLPSDAKESILNFIQHEASETQLMALLLDGKVQNVSEVTKPIVQERFNASPWAVAQETFAENFTKKSRTKKK